MKFGIFCPSQQVTFEKVAIASMKSLFTVDFWSLNVAIAVSPLSFSYET